MFGRRDRQREKIAEVLLRARGHRPGDYGRWRILEELDGIDQGAVFDEAMQLCRGGIPEEITLGAEMLDGVLCGDGGSDRRKAEARSLLIDICRPAQDPGVLAAALHPLAMTGEFGDLYLDLLGHPDPRVRRSAVRLLSAAVGTEAHTRVVRALIQILDEDPDDEVRAEAADSLSSWSENDVREQPDAIAEALSRHLDSPIPAIRVAASFYLSATGDERGFAGLSAELASSSAPWQAVRAVGDLGGTDGLPADVRGELHDTMIRLRDGGWAQHATPGEYPNADQRAEFLREAIEALHH
ncbi:MAG TPA: HEAT repeat domain-containing protein [Streptosporangiaceae bacterium]|nr:HEAT repeat domain-containing protein [Streptosporangiaceae bacterium]